MKFHHRSAISGAFCALAGLASCELPEPGKQDPAPAALGPGAAAPQDPANSKSQASFTAWANALPTGQPQPAMTMVMKMSMSGDLAAMDPGAIMIEGQPAPDMGFAANIQMEGQVADWTRFRLRLDGQMEVAALKEQSGGRPMMMGCNVVADGETIWLEPDWSKAWFAQDLRAQGIGIENMVFSMKVVTVRQLFEVLPLLLPEDDRALMQEAFACTTDPARLAQLTARTSQALSFSQRGGRVYADLEAKPETWAFAVEGDENPFAQMFLEHPMRWQAEFDQATGVMLRMDYAMGMEGATLSMSSESQLVAHPFPPETFRFQLPAGRKVFPVDVFMNPIVMELRRQAGTAADPSQEDFEF
jgi:hypothetical protein